MSCDDDLDAVCTKIDDLVINVFNTMNEIINVRSELKVVLEDGYINLAKARYTMGSSAAVSQIQYSLDDLDLAQCHVKVRENNGLAVFNLEHSSDKHSMENNGKEIRQRAKGGKAENKESHDESVGEDRNHEKPLGKDNSHEKPQAKDPLLWFGVLVPDTLKKSQKSFCRATEIVCQLATLQARLLSERQEIRAAKKHKTVLKSSCNNIKAVES